MLSAEVLARARRIEIRSRQLVDSLFAGEYHSAFRGQGMEFSDLREYSPGDDVRSIDWKVTARMRRPHIRQYTEERELTVMLAIDGSASLDCSSAAESRHEIAAQIASLVALAATRNKDRAGLLLFSSEPEKFTPPSKGKSHVLRMIRDILTFEPQGQTTDLNSALLSLERSLHRRSVIFLLSDFLDEGYEKTLRRLSRRHQMVALKLTDPLDLDLPSSSMMRVADSESGVTQLMDLSNASVRRQLLEKMRQFHQRTEDILKQSGCMLIPIDTTRDPLIPLLKRFRK